MSLEHQTQLGSYFIDDSIQILKDSKEFQGKVQLILTSPPFPLNNKKKYGNLQGDEYKEWFVGLANIFSDLLAEDGSIVQILIKVKTNTKNYITVFSNLKQEIETAGIT